MRCDQKNGRLVKAAAGGLLATLLAACTTGTTSTAPVLTEPAPITATSIHAESIVMDTHADVALPETNAIYLASDGLSKVDPSKLRAGGVGAVVMSLAVPPGPRTPAGDAAGRAEVNRKLAAVQAMAAENADIEIATSAVRIEELHDEGKIALILGLQNARSLEGKLDNMDERTLVFPTKEVWQEVVVKEGQTVKRKELLAKGVTKIFFQANVWVFAVLVILIGSIWGIGKAAVYKHIPEYFPEEVGVVGRMVGVLGGLGGFFSPIIFGYLLDGTGLWTSAWMFMFFLSAICLFWMHRVIQKMMSKKHPELMKKIEQ